MNKMIDIRDTYCDTCMVEYQKQRAEYDKEYNGTRYKSGAYKKAHKEKMQNDEEYRERCKFYSSKQWRQVRHTALTRSKGIDIYDYYINGRFTLGTTIHHIIPRREDKSRQYDIDNLIGLTRDNHKQIHEMYHEDKEGTQQML